MSIRQDQTDTGKYCSQSDVERYIKPADPDTDAFTDATAITADDVGKFIEKWSAKFTRRTGQSWGASQVVDETHDHDRLYYWLSGHPITVMKRNIITPLDDAKGDKLEVWTGNEWEDWVSMSQYSEGRDEDYWVDGPTGIVFVYERAILRPHPKFRLSYRYGNTEDYVPYDVRDAVAAATAADLISSDIYGVTVPGNNNADNTDPQAAADEWREQFENTRRDYTKVRAIWD